MRSKGIEENMRTCSLSIPNSNSMQEALTLLKNKWNITDIFVVSLLSYLSQKGKMGKSHKIKVGQKIGTERYPNKTHRKRDIKNQQHSTSKILRNAIKIIIFFSVTHHATSMKIQKDKTQWTMDGDNSLNKSVVAHSRQELTFN